MEVSKQKTCIIRIKDHYGIILLILICFLFTVAVLIQNTIDDRNVNKHIQEWEINEKIDKILGKWINHFPQGIIGAENIIMNDNPAIPMICEAFHRIQDEMNTISRTLELLESSASDYRFYNPGSLITNSQTMETEEKYILYEHGIVFGPATEIHKGLYTITFLGNGFNHCTFDVFANSNWYAVQYQEKYRDDTKAVLDLYILEDVSDIEYRTFNLSGEETADLYRVVVEKTGNIE